MNVKTKQNKYQTKNIVSDLILVTLAPAIHLVQTGEVSLGPWALATCSVESSDCTTDRLYLSKKSIHKLRVAEGDVGGGDGVTG